MFARSNSEQRQRRWKGGGRKRPMWRPEMRAASRSASLRHTTKRVVLGRDRPSRIPSSNPIKLRRLILANPTRQRAARTHTASESSSHIGGNTLGASLHWSTLLKSIITGGRSTANFANLLFGFAPTRTANSRPPQWIAPETRAGPIARTAPGTRRFARPLTPAAVSVSRRAEPMAGHCLPANMDALVLISMSESMNGRTSK